MIRHRDTIRFEQIKCFFAAVSYLEEVQRYLLGADEERFSFLMSDTILVEFDRKERTRIAVFGSMLEKAQVLFPGWLEMIDWFRGPFPHSKFAGETPAEQIAQNGFDAVIDFRTAFENVVERRGLGLSTPFPPPRHFNLIYVVPW